MIIYVDIDNTICHTPINPYTKKNNYNFSIPLIENIKKINSLYEKGHTIIFWTARGNNTKTNWYELTIEQLKKWNVKYHKLEIGTKPSYDLLIDDKSIRMEELL